MYCIPEFDRILLFGIPHYSFMSSNFNVFGVKIIRNGLNYFSVFFLFFGSRNTFALSEFISMFFWRKQVFIHQIANEKRRHGVVSWVIIFIQIHFGKDIKLLFGSCQGNIENVYII